MAHTVRDDEGGSEIIRIISARCAEPEKRVMSKIVRYEIDLNNLPPLTDAQKAEFRALSEMPDNQIDTSDIPPLDADFWKNAVRNPLPICQIG